MTLSLSQLLLLLGRLDDDPAFDSATERLRRFLREYGRDAELVRGWIAQARHVPGEQYERVLRDLVCWLGHALGFDVTFPDTSGRSGALRWGRWRSPSSHELAVVVQSPWSGSPTPVEVQHVLEAGRELANIAAPLLVRLTPPAERAPGARPDVYGISVIDLESLLRLSDLVARGALPHADVLAVLEAGVPLNRIVDALDRSVDRHEAAASDRAEPAVDAGVKPPRYWVAGVVPDIGMTSEEFLKIVVAGRQVVGLGESSDGQRVSPGDGLCFFVPPKGVVGHATVTSEVGAAVLRDHRRFRQVVELEQIDLHVSTPAPLDSETVLRVRRATPVGRSAPMLVPISFDSYLMLTSTVGARTGPGNGLRERDLDAPAASTRRGEDDRDVL
ncbi:MAG: hypothetical protein IT184_12490 [Acidobacteria bacterium]|nr:hypothetical protein [Acidobacteriota bacterium]